LTAAKSTRRQRGCFWTPQVDARRDFGEVDGGNFLSTARGDEDCGDCQGESQITNGMGTRMHTHPEIAFNSTQFDCTECQCRNQMG
jgi:hypothetical protein